MSKRFDELRLTPEAELPREFLAACRSVEAGRARKFIEHVLRHGYITSDDLRVTYGYSHPPRAARDVKENGIPVLMTRLKDHPEFGRTAAYTFDLSKKVRKARIGGRKAFTRKFKKELIEYYGARDALTGEVADPTFLQIDHRVPYEVSGDDGSVRADEYMLLDGSSQRRKSWACEQCENWRVIRSVENCRACYWAFPSSYRHVAMRQERRVDLSWTGVDVADYQRLEEEAASRGIPLSTLIKSKLLE